MTNNPTIDGVSRELIARAVTAAHIADCPALRNELRALLDADHSVDSDEKVTLREHCKQCAEMTKDWPESKRNCLGGAPAVERQEAKPYPDRLCHIDYSAHPYRCGCLRGDDEAQRIFDEHQAAALHSTIAQLQARIADHEQAMESLKDPESVLVNMLRGSIAKLSVRSFVKTHGEVINGDEAQLLEISRLRERIAELESGRGGAVTMDGKTTIRQYCADTVPDDECADEWTKGYEECKRRIHAMLQHPINNPPAPVGVSVDPCNWSDGQILDFLGVALRNVDLAGEVKLSEIRQGFEYVRQNACLDATAALNEGRK